jgi:DNA-binding MarR family transcriptional regulator
MPAHPTSHEALTSLILEVFRLNGALLATGDALVGDLGLTSARWQVLGAISASAVPLPVAHIARNMHLTRQAVQRVVDDMYRASLVVLADNPHDRRAKLVSLTKQGHLAYRQAMIRQASWAEAVVNGLGVSAMEDAAGVLRSLRGRLDQVSTQ